MELEGIGTEILHYKRGILYIDKLIKVFPNGRYDKKNELLFAEKEYDRFRNYYIASFDLNNFMILCSVALMGLNKEAIEKSGNNKEYKYILDYSNADLSNMPIEMIKFFNEFNSNRVIESDYDEWLSINNIKILPNFDYNYLFNVRNAFMHSEYNLYLLEGYFPMGVNIRNGNYTNFSAKVFLPKYFEFIKHYFGNDVFLGVVDNLYGYNINDDNVNINNELELKNFIINDINVSKYTYDNKLKANRIYEKTLFSTNGGNKITEHEMKKHNILENPIILDTDDVEQIILSIKGYYGENFYRLNDNKKIMIIITAIRYRLDTKGVISTWIIHFYRLMVGVPRNVYYGDGFNSFFAMKPTLLLLKSYLILYRIQNKELLNYEIDYNLVNKFKFDYDLNYYNDYKVKLGNKGILADEDEYMVRYFVEVFRDSLAHGNVDTFFKDENGVINQYFKFTDKWKTKERNIVIDINELEKFLSSECFLGKYLNEKIIKCKTK